MLLRFKPLLVMTLLVLALPGHAAPKQPLGDLSLPIHIQSDQASFEHALKQATHLGNVVLTQGSHELHADKLVVKKEANDTNVLIATGKPATFKGLMMNDPNPVTATANTIYFYPDKKLIVFEGSATLNHEKDKFKGPSLSYQIDQQTILATSTAQERPSIVIQPRRNQ